MSAEKKFLRKKKLFEKITGIFKVKLAIKRYPKQYIKKVTAALTAGILGVVLAGTMPEQIEKIAENRQEQTAITAWWGTLYPKFCFSQFPEDHKDRKEDIKISFWLAQALDW